MLTTTLQNLIMFLTGLPELDFAIYMLINCGIWVLLWFALQKQYGLNEWSPHFWAFLASFGPLIIAQIMTNITETSKRSILYPFHKEGWKEMSFHLLISSLVCIGPVYAMVHMALSDPGNAIYFWIRN